MRVVVVRPGRECDRVACDAELSHDLLKRQLRLAGQSRLISSLVLHESAIPSNNRNENRNITCCPPYRRVSRDPLETRVGARPASLTWEGSPPTFCSDALKHNSIEPVPNVSWKVGRLPFVRPLLWFRHREGAAEGFLTPGNVTVQLARTALSRSQKGITEVPKSSSSAACDAAVWRSN
jgi:hypothetical protein